MLSLDDYFTPLPSGAASRFLEAHESGGHRRWKTALAFFRQAVELASSAYRGLPDYLKEEYPEVDLVKTTRKGIADRKAFMAGGDERAPRKPRSKRPSPKSRS